MSTITEDRSLEKALRRAIRRVVRAEINASWKGSLPPLERIDAWLEVRAARKALSRVIERVLE